ncbi:AAA family ATPase [Vibrio splendidus]|nr:AAA family ATPase [Vibrio splendidus]MCC4881858.1 AAA family ATPase [Vibrio splendidus]
MIIDKIEFKEDYRTYKKGQVIEIKDKLTVITGDNGVGKTTLFSCIRGLVSNRMQHDMKDAMVNEQDININSLCISFAKDLLSNRSGFDHNIDLQLRCMGVSSGQGLIVQLADELTRERELIVLDEPERGLSIAKQIMVARMISEYMDKYPHCQVIIFTHSKDIMGMKEEVLTLPENTYLPIGKIDDYFRAYSLMDIGDAEARHSSARYK